MRRPPPLGWGPGLGGYGFLAFFAVVVNLEFFVMEFYVFRLRMPLRGLDEYEAHVGMLALYGVALLLWSAAFALGRVGSHTGAGFRIAGLGLVAHLLCTSFVIAYGLDESRISVYDVAPRNAAYVWLGRNIGPVAYAFGLLFVALASWNDWRLKRTAPAWVIPFEG